MAWAALKRNASRFVQAFNTETRIACRSWTIHWLGWCWPLLLFGVISGVYQAGTLLDMPLAVIDKDHSQLSRKLIRDLDATSHAQVITVPAGVQEGLDAIRRADAYALLYIPPDFEADVLGGRAPKAELYYNALLYSAGYAAAGLLGAGRQPQRRIASAPGRRDAGGAAAPGEHQRVLRQPVQCQRQLHLLPAVRRHRAPAAAVRDRHHGPCAGREAPELRASSPHILRAKALGVRLVGKLAPYTLLFTALLMLEIFLLVAFSGARINGSPLAMLMITLFYVIAAQSVGLMLFVFTANRFTAYSLVGMLIGVAQTYSGVLIPELAMPTLARVIAEAEPLTHTLHGLFDQFLRQAPPSSALYTCAKLALYPLIAYMIAKMRLRSRLDLSPI